MPDFEYDDLFRWQARNLFGKKSAEVPLARIAGVRRDALASTQGSGQQYSVRLVAELDDRPLIPLSKRFSDLHAKTLDRIVAEFFLIPEYRGHGIGRQVLDSIRDEARKMDINALHLEVARDNDNARGLYQAAGFAARGKYLLMSLDLHERE